MKLTEKQKKSYLNAKGTRCPYCGSSCIEGGPIEIEAGSAYQEICCANCDAMWNDIYTLTDIEEVDDD